MSEDSTNVFIDFSIVVNSDVKRLSQEFDILIAAQKKIYIWSVNVPIEDMMFFCQNTEVPTDKEEKEKAKKCWKLRKDGKTYKSISEETEVPLERVGFYVNRDPDKSWVLDDWVVDYFVKDSSVYAKVDMVIDPEQRFVDKFKRANIEGNVIQRI